MTVTISRLYENYADAQRAITSLEAAGVPHSDLSIIANNSDNWYGAEKKVDRTEEGAATGAGIGAGLGGAAGLLAGLGVLAIPGLGPVVAAGWLASTTLGVMAGAATGTIVGALTEAGVSEEEAPLYAEGVRRGGTLGTRSRGRAGAVRIDLGPIGGQYSRTQRRLATVRLGDL